MHSENVSSILTDSTKLGGRLLVRAQSGAHAPVAQWVEHSPLSKFDFLARNPGGRKASGVIASGLWWL